MFSRTSRRGHDRSTLPGNYDNGPDTPTKQGFFIDVPSRVPRQLRTKKFIFSLFVFIIFLGTLYSRSRDLLSNGEDSDYDVEEQDPESYPQIYMDLYEQERMMPQHNASLPFPEGENGRFMWVSNQIWGLGWNNAFQALYMLTHLAYLSNRAFVFRPYTWDEGEALMIPYNGQMIPSRVPLAALVSGPIAGGDFPSNHPAPRAVNEDFFHQVCPEERITKVSISKLKEGTEWAEGINVLEKYRDVLRDMSEGCVELYGGVEHLFDTWLFGNKRLLSIYPSISQSPILTHFSWSPLVLSAIKKNAKLIAPAFESGDLPESVNELMTIHVRRGDFIDHCNHLAEWSSTFMGWCQNPRLLDSFEIPPGGGVGWTTDKNRAIYLDRCWPEIPAIVERVAAARELWESSGHEKIRRVYIMTNGKTDFVDELKDELRKLGRFDSVSSSRDIKLTRPQKYIAQAMDMAIAERAGLFVGNGFSSLSANVLLMRQIRHHSLESNRLW